MSVAGLGEGTGWLLALHSSSECLGVAIQPLGAAQAPATWESFPMGRALSNHLFPCVEMVLPAREWIHVGRLAVATGPGGFTGTRLTVALARTLAQQLKVPLDGFSSFHLIARRLWAQESAALPLILSQPLPRHGVVAGLYGPDPADGARVRELSAPRLYESEEDAQRSLGCHRRRDAQPELPADVRELLALSQAAAALGREAPWAGVLPLYPTSPVSHP
ncbi:MAG: tRNA (adenosine(37)-N6)-threonylcarbamoyltransferase complex dimerization subunit type 1 TsaB [Cyanobacteriota bacterium]|jgi:tRNA threonylcarbamoyladenosine biosynthesis protein TsaB|nr:tRNA (adenosine(37)-N6)-threonylcarbamoyltransferase complex dimerization subunit type 1 TsaB [Cyanobacteriota bacterium]